GLVASRLRLLTVQSSAERLDPTPLAGGLVDRPERQRTIEGAIRWSHDLLSEPERRLFARLAVFAGGARLEEIEAVCGPDLPIPVLEGLATLVDQSLRSEEHTSELQSRENLVCRLLLEKKK